MCIENICALTTEWIKEINGNTAQLNALDKNLLSLWDNLKRELPEQVQTNDDEIFAQRLKQCMDEENERKERKKARQASKRKP